jgi:deoxyribonuclease-1-like protein
VVTLNWNWVVNITGICSLASKFDNIWYNSSKIKTLNAGIIHFYKDFESLLAARKTSDHVPVTVKINLQ